MLAQWGPVSVGPHSASSKTVLGAGVSGVKMTGWNTPSASIVKPLISPPLVDICEVRLHSIRTVGTEKPAMAHCPWAQGYIAMRDSVP
jgi:hypothetical protein